MLTGAGRGGRRLNRLPKAPPLNGGRTDGERLWSTREVPQNNARWQADDFLRSIQSREVGVGSREGFNGSIMNNFAFNHFYQIGSITLHYFKEK